MRTGGAESIVVSLGLAAAGAGHEVAVVAAPGEMDDALANGPVGRFSLPVLAGRPWRVPAAVAALHRAVRRFDPQVIHVHNPRMAAVAVPILRARRQPGLVSVHGVPESAWPSAVRALRWTRLPVIACGPGVAAALSDHGLPPAATVVNGIPPGPPPADRDVVLSEAGFPADTRLLVMVGRLSAVKNHEMALRALARLDERVRLLVVGEGDQRQRIDHLTAELSLDGRVCCVGRRSGRPLMAAADVNCITSTSEGMPLAALEAMASGRPLVATDVRGLRELVDDGRTGLLVPPADPDALAAAVRRLLDDEALAAELAVAAAAVAAECSESAMIDGYLQLYETLRR